MRRLKFLTYCNRQGNCVVVKNVEYLHVSMGGMTEGLANWGCLTPESCTFAVVC